MESRSLRNMTAHHSRCLDIVKRKHAVEIRVDGTTAVISGFRDFVAEAVPSVKELARRMGSVTPDADILRTVQWEWQPAAGTAAATAQAYPPDAIVYLEHAWKMRQKKVDVLFDGQSYVIDFEKMQEVCKASGKAVPIVRRLLNTSDLTTVVPGRDHQRIMDVSCQNRIESFYLPL